MNVKSSLCDTFKPDPSLEIQHRNYINHCHQSFRIQLSSKSSSDTSPPKIKQMRLASFDVFESHLLKSGLASCTVEVHNHLFIEELIQI